MTVERCIKRFKRLVLARKEEPNADWNADGSSRSKFFNASLAQRKKC